MNLRSWLGAGLVVALVGCGGDRLPRVRYGEEACAHCRMIINDDRFAAAVAEPSGEIFKFDDVGCLVAFLQSNARAGARRWVRGYQSNEWLNVEEACFVYGPELQTPMASGVAAVKSPADAEALAREWQGKSLRFADLASFLNARPDADGQRASAATTTSSQPSEKEPERNQ